MAGGSTSALSLSRPAQASLALRPVGSLSRPKATFVARLQPSQLPSQAAHQLPDPIENCPGEPSSTDDPRRKGALPIRDVCRMELLQPGDSPTRNACEAEEPSGHWSLPGSALNVSLRCRGAYTGVSLHIKISHLGHAG